LYPLILLFLAICESYSIFSILGAKENFLNVMTFTNFRL